MDLPLQQLLEDLEGLSVEVGNWMADQAVSDAEIEQKGFNNLVSFVDKGAEERFVSALSKLLPQAGFIAEEGTGKRSADGLNWIIDPLDGTTNYLHRFPIWCTSVALHHPQDGLLLGVIYDPNRNEVFSAAKGQGSKLNGKPMQVSACTELKQALIGTGFPYDDFGRSQEYLGLLDFMTRNTRGVRRPGSAAIDLAYVAAGRLDAFYEYALNPWDVAAGILLIQEAGGSCSGFPGNNDPLFGPDLMASNNLLHDAMSAAIGKHFSTRSMGL